MKEAYNSILSKKKEIVDARMNSIRKYNAKLEEVRSFIDT